MAVMKCTFVDGKLRILEVLKIQPGDSLMTEKEDCVTPRKEQSPADTTREQLLPCPGTIPRKAP
jgi:hypothetical protein